MLGTFPIYTSIRDIRIQLLLYALFRAKRTLRRPDQVGDKQNRLFSRCCHRGLYPSEYRAFPFPVYANQPQKRLPFAGSQLEVFDKRQSRLVVKTGQEGQAAPRLCNLVAQSPGDAERGIQAGSREGISCQDEKMRKIYTEVWFVEK
jgi:hypothetical protein